MNEMKVFSIWLSEFYRRLRQTGWNGGPVLNCSNQVQRTWDELAKLFVKRYSPSDAVESLSWPF